MIEDLLLQLKTDLTSNLEDEELCIDRFASLGSVSFSILEKLLKASNQKNILESLVIYSLFLIKKRVRR